MTTYALTTTIPPTKRMTISSTGTEGDEPENVVANATPDSKSTSSTLIASALAGSLARIPVHPIDTIKAKLQVLGWKSPDAVISSSSTGGSTSYRALPLAKQVLKTEGIRGVYKGLGKLSASAPRC